MVRRNLTGCQCCKSELICTNMTYWMNYEIQWQYSRKNTWIYNYVCMYASIFLCIYPLMYPSIHPSMLLPESSGGALWLRDPVMAFSRASTCVSPSTALCSLVTAAALSGPRAVSCSSVRDWRENSKWHRSQRGGRSFQILYISNTTKYKYQLSAKQTFAKQM